jgi:hypothetical protein
MINIAEIQHELAQARQARIAAQLAGCEVEEMADTLRQMPPCWRQSEPARRRPGALDY